MPWDTSSRARARSLLLQAIAWCGVVLAYVDPLLLDTLCGTSA